MLAAYSVVFNFVFAFVGAIVVVFAFFNAAVKYDASSVVFLVGFILIAYLRSLNQSIALYQAELESKETKVLAQPAKSSRDLRQQIKDSILKLIYEKNC